VHALDVIVEEGILECMQDFLDVIVEEGILYWSACKITLML
jgi:hypothetical protein